MGRLRGRRWLARAAILFEQAWPALWPAFGVGGLFVCLALLDIPSLLPPLAHAFLTLAALAAVLALLAGGLWRIRWPRVAEADRRLERASGLRHRPLAVLADRPARPDPAAEGLWQAHVARALGDVRRLRVGLPRPGLARLDRRALRGGLAVLLVAALVVAGPDAPARLARAVQVPLPSGPAAPATEIQAWITPPAYTSLPPLFLHPEANGVRVPAGSHLTVSVTGGEGEPSLAIAGRPSPVRALDAGSFQADADLWATGLVELRRGGRGLASWTVTTIPDQPPTVAWAEPPGRAARGLQTRLPWRAADDYGVTVLQAELRLEARPDAPPVTLTLPVPAGPAANAHGVSLQDLTANPWAGLDVTARLVARDASGQSAASEDARFTLPERAFQNPVAQALIGARKLLSLDPDDRDPASAMLDDLLQHPEAMAGDTGAYLNLAAIYALLVRDRGADAVPEAQARMWRLALHLEEGAAEQTARALEQARQAARDALDRATATPSAKASAELEQRLRELEAAIQRHMQALAEQARREGALTLADPNGRPMDSRDLQRMAEQAREAAREGKMDEARRRMAELERMLERLRNARVMPNGEQRQRAEQRQKARRQQGALQDMIGRETGLLDRAHQRGNAAESGSQPGEGRTAQRRKPGAGAQPGGDPAAQREADRRVQQALRRALGELMQQFGDATGQIPPSLGDAKSAMREAGQALAGGRDDEAGGAEGRAIEALQKGGQEMGQAMARKFGPGTPGDEEGDDGDPTGMSGFSLQEGPGEGDDGQGVLPGQRGRQGRRDPLGRQLGEGNSGADEGSDVRVPEEMERQRSRAIQEELRRRGADRARPQQELDYIDRLLKPF